jgi:hypothetical protein
VVVHETTDPEAAVIEYEVEGVRDAQTERRRNEAWDNSRYVKRLREIALNVANCVSSTGNGAGTADKTPTRACWTLLTRLKAPFGSWGDCRWNRLTNTAMTSGGVQPSMPCVRGF